jgi:hypothetical protein
MAIIILGSLFLIYLVYKILTENKATHLVFILIRGYKVIRYNLKKFLIVLEIFHYFAIQ